MKSSYSIDNGKRRQIIGRVQAELPEATVDDIDAYCLDDWEGQRHQDWLDSASPDEIVSWAVTGLRDVLTYREVERGLEVEWRSRLEDPSN